jgi:hypothetical protein
MSPPRTTPGEAKNLDARQLLDQFEQAWRKGNPPRLETLLPPLASADMTQDPARRELLFELVTTDLEYHWRCATDGATRPCLEQYVQRYPELGPLERLSLDLIGYEYRVRHWWGDRPGHGDYTARFPRHGPALLQKLAGIDAELAIEFRGQGQAIRSGKPNLPSNSVFSVEVLTRRVPAGPTLPSYHQPPCA